MKKKFTAIVLYTNLLTAFLLYIVLSIGLTSCTGCSSDEKQKTEQARTIQQEKVFTGKDSAEILKLTTQYLDLVKEKRNDEAIAVLHKIDGDSIGDIPEKEKTDLMTTQKVFPVLSYKLEDIKFHDERYVEVVYEIEFFEKAPNEQMPNTYKLTFSPKRINGTWYLTLMNKSFMK